MSGIDGLRTWTRVHPAALERLRVRTQLSASSIIRATGLSVEEFRMRLREQTLTPENIQTLASALGVTPRDIVTASTFHFASDAIRRDGVE